MVGWKIVLGVVGATNDHVTLLTLYTISYDLRDLHPGRKTVQAGVVCFPSIDGALSHTL